MHHNENDFSPLFGATPDSATGNNGNRRKAVAETDISQTVGVPHDAHPYSPIQIPSPNELTATEFPSTQEDYSASQFAPPQNTPNTYAVAPGQEAYAAPTNIYGASGNNYYSGQESHNYSSYGQPSSNAYYARQSPPHGAQYHSPRYADVHYRPAHRPAPSPPSRSFGWLGYLCAGVLAISLLAGGVSLIRSLTGMSNPSSGQSAYSKYKPWFSGWFRSEPTAEEIIAHYEKVARFDSAATFNSYSASGRVWMLYDHQTKQISYPDTALDALQKDRANQNFLTPEPPKEMLSYQEEAIRTFPGFNAANPGGYAAPPKINPEGVIQLNAIPAQKRIYMGLSFALTNRVGLNAKVVVDDKLGWSYEHTTGEADKCETLPESKLQRLRNQIFLELDVRSFYSGLEKVAYPTDINEVINTPRPPQEMVYVLRGRDVDGETNYIYFDKFTGFVRQIETIDPANPNRIKEVARIHNYMSTAARVVPSAITSITIGQEEGAMYQSFDTVLPDLPLKDEDFKSPCK